MTEYITVLDLAAGLTLLIALVAIVVNVIALIKEYLLDKRNK